MNKTLKTFIAFMMIFTIFSTTLFQTAASAATVDNIQINTTDKVEIGVEVTPTEKVNATSSSLPPRDPKKDPLWIWVLTVMSGFVAIKTAEIFVENAINNGIDAACKKFKDTPGVKQACAIIN